jgi:pimeloyl-ACP methyl ester carboxylesterase
MPQEDAQHDYGRSPQYRYGWVPCLNRLYRVVRPDMRALGSCSADFDLATGMTLMHCVNDLLTILDDLGAGVAHFCGESAGGLPGTSIAREKTHERKY